MRASLNRRWSGRRHGSHLKIMTTVHARFPFLSHPFTTALCMGSAAILLSAIHARAQDAGALVDVLVRKGILSTKEAAEVRSELSRDMGQTSAGKIKLSD